MEASNRALKLTATSNFREFDHESPVVTPHEGTTLAWILTVRPYHRDDTEGGCVWSGGGRETLKPAQGLGTDPPLVSAPQKDEGGGQKDWRVRGGGGTATLRPHHRGPPRGSRGAGVGGGWGRWSRRLYRGRKLNGGRTDGTPTAPTPCWVVNVTCNANLPSREITPNQTA